MKDVKAHKIVLSDGSEVPYGLLVWSTGVGPLPIIQSLDLPKSPGGRLVPVTQYCCFHSLWQPSQSYKLEADLRIDIAFLCHI